LSVLEGPAALRPAPSSCGLAASSRLATRARAGVRGRPVRDARSSHRSCGTRRPGAGVPEARGACSGGPRVGHPAPEPPRTCGWSPPSACRRGLPVRFGPRAAEGVSPGAAGPRLEAAGALRPGSPT